jgi:O-antigen/teichoic acid export membrane protein
MVSLLTLAALAIIALQDPLFMLLGEKYRPAKSFFPFLLFSPICYTIAETTGLGINISKKTYWNIIIFFSKHYN